MYYIEQDFLHDRDVHHDLLFAKILGLAHIKCNLLVKTESFVPLFFQWIKYDSSEYYLIRSITLKTNKTLAVVPCNDKTFFRSASMNLLAMI